MMQIRLFIYKVMGTSDTVLSTRRAPFFRVFSFIDENTDEARIVSIT